MRREMASLAIVLMLLAACADGSPGEAVRATGEEPATAATEPTESGDASTGAAILDITATEFAFDHAAEVPGGVVELRVENTGGLEHVAILSRLDGGTTFDQAVAALQGPPEGALDTPLLGVAGVSPGVSASAIATLEPGQYLFLCPLPTPEGAPHFAEGMVSALTVKDSGGDGDLPEADGTVVASEFAFDDVPDLTAGEHLVALDNTGEQEHELNLIELAAGKTIDDVIAFYSGPPGAGDPPMRNLGGPLVNPATSQQVVGRFRLEAGKDYAFICAVPDFSDEPPTPHVVKGMHTSTFGVQ